MVEKIGFGGSCHWCTEAIFNALIGVEKVEQGWIATHAYEHSSEAVLVHFDKTQISLDALTAVHLHSHSCTSNHGMRDKYRSAIYTFHDHQIQQSQDAIEHQQKEFDEPIITQVLPFESFTLNDERYLQYYEKNATKDFCVNFIDPKLQRLRKKYKKLMKLS